MTTTPRAASSISRERQAGSDAYRSRTGRSPTNPFNVRFMPTYRAPLADIRFVLEDLLNVGQLATLPGYANATPDVLIAVIEEGRQAL